MTFYIFGDSYGDPNSASDNTYELWCEMLNEPVINNCRGSSGPQYSLRKINEFLKNYPNAKAFKSLGKTLYFSLLNHCDIIIGNSSSGMVETQSFKLPVVNIGNRQKGRKVTENIIHSSGGKKSNLSSIKKGLSKEFRDSINNMDNPYGKEGAGKEIVRILSDLSLTNKLLQKQFIFYGGSYEKN